MLPVMRLYPSVTYFKLLDKLTDGNVPVSPLPWMVMFTIPGRVKMQDGMLPFMYCTVYESNRLSSGDDDERPSRAMDDSERPAPQI